MVLIKYANFVQTGIVNNVLAGSTIIEFSPNFRDIPKVFLTPVTTSTAAWQYSVNNTSTASFELYSDTAGTINWVAVHTS